jgi:hypothetical protein
MSRELRRVWRLLVTSWVCFVLLAVANAAAVSGGFYCGGAR